MRHQYQFFLLLGCSDTASIIYYTKETQTYFSFNPSYFTYQLTKTSIRLSCLCAHSITGCKYKGVKEPFSTSEIQWLFFIFSGFLCFHRYCWRLVLITCNEEIKHPYINKRSLYCNIWQKLSSLISTQSSSLILLLCLIYVLFIRLCIWGDMGAVIFTI